jgi:hypothetical protein
MSSFISRSRFLLPLLAALLTPASPAFAEESVNPSPKRASNFKALPNHQPLVVAKGTFVRGGQNVPATVGNLVDLIREVYRDANITVLGVDDVVIENLKLHWNRRHDPSPDEKNMGLRVDPPLEGILVTLSEASGRKFAVKSFSTNDFLLTAPQGSTNDPGPVVEVFNLTPLLQRGSSRAVLETHVREIEVELAVLRKRPGSKTEKTQELIDLETRVEFYRNQLARLDRPTDDATNKLIEQIELVVSRTLASQKLAEKPPELQFHSGANLLVVIGSRTATEITRKVVAALY